MHIDYTRWYIVNSDETMKLLAIAGVRKLTGFVCSSQHEIGSSKIRAKADANFMFFCSYTQFRH